MATIESAIRLNDMMSAPIRNITNAMNIMLSSWSDLEGVTAGGLDVGSVETIRAELSQATRALDQMGDEQQEFNQKVRQGEDATEALTGNIIGAIGAYASLQSLGQLVNLSDSFTQTQSRLAMIVDEGSNVDELFNKIAESANRSRASIAATADTVAKLSLNAGDAFNSNDETILFAENLNKLFAIAGTEQASIASASLQLTQALGSGVLRGEEFNAVFEAAPNIMQTVADYMGVPIGQLRKMAQEGQITADVVKYALLGATEDINAQFESMPMTWGQVWTGITNELYTMSVPLLEFINLLANNWSVLEPIVLGVASALGIYLIATKGVELATKAWAAAQAFFNGIMAMNPVFIVAMGVALLIGLIYAVVAAINKLQGTTISATGVIMGVLAVAGAFIWNLFLGIVDIALSVVNTLGNLWLTFANFFGNIFNDPIGAIIGAFGGLADAVLGILESIAGAIDKVFGSNLADAVSGWRGTLGEKVAGAIEKYGNGTYEEVADKFHLTAEDFGLDRWSYGDAWGTGYDFGAGLGDSIGSFFGGGSGGGGGADDPSGYQSLLNGIGDIPTFTDIAGNTADTAKALEVTHEDLKYLREVAEQGVINRFTTAEIRVEMGGVNNTVNNNADLDGIIDYMVGGINEAMERVAEGVHE